MIGTVVSHFKVVAEVGRGSMAEVYRAEDLLLHRPVALKVCDADRAAHLLREAQLVSSLSHPGIAIVHEVGEFEREGTRKAFVAMEFVLGKTLAQLKNEVSRAEILSLVIQTAEALGEAHNHGVIHRDLKPSNVMVTDTGRVKVLDFGLAKYIPPLDEKSPTLSGRVGDLSTPGDLIGTVAYMSPEQARGWDVDARADVFSLGVVLYELLAGCLPFAGGNVVEVFDSILHAAPPALPDSREEMSALVRRMMAKDPQARPATMQEVVSELQAIARGEGPRVTGPPAACVAVMGFRNITGSPDDDWLGTGIAETIAADLKGVEGLSILSRERTEELLRASDAQKAPDGTLASFVGRETGATYVVEGAFQVMGQAVRITAQITDVSGDKPLWNVKIDGELPAIFELQDRVVRELSQALRPGARAREAEETEVLEAYEAYAKGLVNLNVESHESLDRAIFLFELATEKDPRYARAHFRLGRAQASKAEYLGIPELQKQALKSLERALELQPSLQEALCEKGIVLVHLGREDEGIQVIERALALDPVDPTAHSALGRAYFLGKGDFRRAALSYERALKLDPLAGWSALQLSHCAALLREYARGEAAARRAIVLQEEFRSGRRGIVLLGSHMRLGHLFALQEKNQEARREFEAELEFLSRIDHALKGRIFIEIHMRLGEILLRTGDPAGQAALDLALEAFERRIRLGSDDPFTRYYAAAAYALRGDASTALDCLEKAVQKRPAFTCARARIEPEFRSLRSDPRFQSLMGAS